MSWDNAAGSNWNDGEGTVDTWATGENAAGVHGTFDSGKDGDFTASNGGAHHNGEDGQEFKCRRCGEPGHMARQCPSAPEGAGSDGKCFNCGEEGHVKAACTMPRVFKGTCRICEQVGHPAAECPEKPAPKCYNCKEEGHIASECKNNRVFDTTKVEDLSMEEAWTKLLKADEERDLDDFRDAFKIYCKAAPEATYEEMERAFRLNDFNVYLIATEKELPKTHTYVNLQGELDKTYQVGFQLSPKPKRANAIQGWPKDANENLERLRDAGLPMDRGIPKCTRCNELGHTARDCPEEPMENLERIQVKCVNCDQIGHRARDCPTPRTDRFACRNCKQSGHTSAECTEPRSAEGVECRKCNEMGHFSKDCPTGGSSTCRNCGEEGHMSKECDKPRNPANVTCRNCDEIGHFSRDCPKPRDYSKMKCSNCGEMGHGKARCKNPPAETGDVAAGDDGGFGDASAAGVDIPPSAGGGDNWAKGPSDSGADSWGAGPAAATAGGW